MAVVLLVFTALPLAKEQPPKPEKMKKLSFPKYNEFTTKNEIECVVIEHHEQPLVTVAVVVKAGGVLDPWEKISLSGFTSELLNKGTKSRNADELAVWIESVGGQVGLFSGDDYAYVSVSVLTEYLDTAYEYLADIIMNPVFPEDELEIHRKRIKTALEFELSQPNSMAVRHFNEVVYGDHPYAKAPTTETVEALTREDIVAFHKKNYVANNALIAVVGDVKSKQVKKDVQKYFGSWEQGEPEAIVYTSPPERTSAQIYLYHRPGAVQTNYRVGHLGLRPKESDWPAVIVTNRLFGGGADARLFANLREDKGWTYGAYSSFSRDPDIGTFETYAAVGTGVTDSALVELMKELDRLKSEPVTEEELQNAKNYLIGNFPNTIETPDQIAGQVIQTRLLGLGKKHLETYRDQLAKVTVDDISLAVQKYLHPDKVAIILVGDATEIMEKVEKELATDVALFDIEGQPLSPEALAVEAVSYEYDTSPLKDMKATYSLSMQTMSLGNMSVDLQKKGDGSNEVIEVSTKMAGMISLDETMVVNASNLAPVSYKSNMIMGPRTMMADLQFEGGSGSGSIKGIEDAEPKTVSIKMVGGTLLDGAVELAISVLPIEVEQTYRFPIVDTGSGNLQNLDIEIMEEVTVEVEAGSFDTFKLKVKRSEGEQIVYCTKEVPRIIVKREIPAQAVNIELKELLH